MPGRWAGWHTFGVIWVPGRVTFFYDGRNAGTISEGITGSPMYLVMLNTIGHGSPPRAGTVLIDWVKAWATPLGAALAARRDYAGMKQEIPELEQL